MTFKIIGKTKEGNMLSDLDCKGIPSLMAQFVGQPSKYVQELVLVTEDPYKTQRAVGVYAQGRDVIRDYRSAADEKKWRDETSAKVAKNLARLLADEIRLGFTHRDIGAGNIIISPDGYDPEIKIIDFGESAVSTLEENFEEIFIKGMKIDYMSMKRTLEDVFGDEDKMEKDLLDYFDREFERSILRMNGESAG